VFTKPWKDYTTDELFEIVSRMGFDGIEFPLRDGYQVTPATAVAKLKSFAEKLAEYNIKITSVAATTDENIFEACQIAGIDLIRIMFNANLDEGYMKSEYKMKKQIESFLPYCEKYKVRVGIQHHYGPMVSNSMELRHVLEGFDPKYVGAIWDAAHSGLAGEEPEQGLDIVWDYLMLVNLKTACYITTNGPELERTIFNRYFTTGRYGICDWERVIRFLKKKNYSGVLCLPAEYTDEKNVEKYAISDLQYVKSIVEKVYMDEV
jgi:sugar phosphate isomerase/epimerase